MNDHPDPPATPTCETRHLAAHLSAVAFAVGSYAAWAGRHMNPTACQPGAKDVARPGAVCLAILLAAPTAEPMRAGDLRVATQNMKLALELCLRNYRSAADLPNAFAAAGYTLGAGLDLGAYEFSAPGVLGGFEAGYCFIQSEDVPLAIAEDMGLRLSEALFPGKVEVGNPELPVGAPVPQCDGLSIFAPQSLIRVTYAAAGNSGDCINNGTSAVLVNM